MDPTYSQAIKDIESSGGDYNALGPVTDGGDRAYGAYQVMGNNVPDWTEKHYGTRLTPDQFLDNKDAQDAVFNGEFGSYVKKYGNPQDAASMWFSGKPMAQAGDASDGGLTVPQYVQKFNAGLAKHGGGVDAINAAAGIKPAGGTGALSLAEPDAADADSEDTGALSPANTVGPGALTKRVMKGDSNDSKLDILSQGGMGIAAALAGISSPQQAYALNQQLQSMKKDNQSKYKVSVMKDGRIMRVDDSGNVDVSGTSPAEAAAKPVPAIGDFSKTGEDYLATVPDTQKAIVQGVAEGLIPPPSPYKMGDPNVQAIIAAAHQYDKSFDATTWSGRVAGQKDWATGGKSADIVKSLNQSIGHLSDLPSKFDALNNGQSPLANEAGNWWNQQVLGKPAVTGFKLNAHAVADEMGKLFKGAGLSDREIKQWEEGLGENMSPDQQRESMTTLSGLVRHSMSALEEKRRQAIGPMAATKKGALLDGDASGSLDSIDNWVKNGTPSKPSNTKRPPLNQLIPLN